MSRTDLQSTIDEAFENRDSINTGTTGEVRDAVEEALGLLDDGSERVAERSGDGWVVNQWLKKAVLLSFRLNDMTTITAPPESPTPASPNTESPSTAGRGATSDWSTSDWGSTTRPRPHSNAQGNRRWPSGWDWTATCLSSR